MTVRIQTHPFDLAAEELKIRAQSKEIGALVAFQGMVRGSDHGKTLTHLYLEHYPNVTETEITNIIQLANTRWTLQNTLVIHRVGKLAVGDPIILIIVTAQHRKEAFEATEFIMDYLKTNAPFWKKEYFTDGSADWVKAKHSDQQQANRWQP